MAAKPLTSEAIALAEKKMDMTLDDIIKMSKKTISKFKKPRVANKSRGFLNGAVSPGNTSKVLRFIDSRSAVRQGVLAQKRSNFRSNQFPLTAEAARKAAQTPLRKMANWNMPRAAAPVLQRKVGEPIYTGKAKAVLKQRPRTLDLLFAGMKEQRQRSWSQQVRWQQRGNQPQQQQRGRRGATGAGKGRLMNRRLS